MQRTPLESGMVHVSRRTGLTLLPHAEHEARRAFATLVWRANPKRKPEGTFNTETMLFEPSAREAGGWDGTPPALPITRFRSFNHVWILCNRGCNGLDVPPDIAKACAELWPKIHEREMTRAVDVQLKAESEAFEKRMQAEKAAALEAHTRSAEGRLAAQLERYRRLEAKMKALETRRKTLTTLMKQVARSIAALKRSVERKAKR